MQWHGANIRLSLVDFPVSVRQASRVMVLVSDAGRDAQRIHGRQDTAPKLDYDVQRKEDAIASQLQAHAGFLDGPSLPTRPGFGSRGSHILLYANCFQLSTSSGCEVFRYNIETEQNHGVRKLRQIFHLLLDQQFSHFRDYIASDFCSTLICPFDLLQGAPSGIYDVRYKGEFEDEYPTRPTVFRVRVISTGKISISALLDYLSSTNVSETIHRKAEVLHVLGVILSHHSRTSPNIAHMVGTKRFAIAGELAERSNLGAGLEALRGFSISVRAATARLLLNCQVEYAVCFQGGPLTEVIAAYRQEASPSISRLEGFLRRLQVQVTHISKEGGADEYIPRFKIIAGLASPSDGRGLPHPPIVARHGAGPREVQFWLRDFDECGEDGDGDIEMGEVVESEPERGRYITVEDYFSQRYGICLNPDIPVVKLLTRSKTPCYVPAEVCTVRAGQPARAHLSMDQNQKMINTAIRNPAVNARSIVTKGAEIIGISTQSENILQKFGVQISPHLINVPGRVLPSPSVLYANKAKADVSSGVWRQKGARFYKPSRLSSWAFLYIVSARDREYFKTPAELQPCLAALRSKLHDSGVSARPVSDGQRVDVTLAHSHGRYDAVKLDQIIGTAVSHLKSIHKLELLLAILPSTNTDIYSSVKRVCDVHLGINNLCVLASKIAKPNNQQYLSGVCLKLNLKLGGVNQILGPDRSGLISEGKTMIVGVDVTHPSPGSAPNTPSVAGMVASIDKTLAQWPADLQIQDARQETGAPLDRMLKSRLDLWTSVNGGRLPENIIIYRDGVADTQYDAVVTDEVPLLQAACENIYPQSSRNAGLPHLAVIIVGKRHRTRFYPTRPSDADALSNPKNGTVVDRGVTEAREWDFYLQSHTALHGTARPAHYYVVWDEIFRARRPNAPLANAAEVLEDFTHDLCYLFGRATRAVSTVPPAYYADLVCERARCYLRDVFEAGGHRGLDREVGEDGFAELVSRFERIRVHPALRRTMFYI
ncbi:putative RNA interference and gene silencing protein [Aspergillus egyptiacus]|nr:putative RNA interference and gene silencing protein [Aspergillus egyptiacus]